jgi:hypothetical protein
VSRQFAKTYVQPDPETFNRIAGLFDAAAHPLRFPVRRLELPHDPTNPEPNRNEGRWQHL